MIDGGCCSCCLVVSGDEGGFDFCGNDDGGEHCRRRGFGHGSRLFSGVSVRLPRLLVAVKSKLRCGAPVAYDDERHVVRSAISCDANLVLFSVVSPPESELRCLAVGGWHSVL